VLVTSAVERISWRLDVYDRICQACAQSGIAPLRFLAFRPDKMRIRIGESLMRSQVPVIFAADLGDRLSAILPSAQPVPAMGALGFDRDTLRRVIALTQIDGDLDPIDVASYAVGGERPVADGFLGTFQNLYERFFEEAKASGSGEDTAALFQLVSMSSLRNVLLHKVGASDRFLGLGALLAHLCDRALTATVAKEGEGLTARLGLLLAASCSPLALMGAAPAVAARPGNVYRTVPSAFLRARDLVRAHMDQAAAFDVVAARARLAAEMLSDAVRRRDLVRSLLAEAVRDLATLSTLTQGTELRDLAGKTAALGEALFQPLGPEKLRARIERHPRGAEEPLSRLLVFVDSIGAVLAGDLEPLKRIGSIEQRADTAAAGALLLAFDELSLEQGAHALGMVRPVPPEEAQKAREDGRAYFFGFDDEPLFLSPKRREEAFLFADMKDFTKRTVAIQEESMGDFLKTRFYEPILRTCTHYARNPQARVSVVNLLGDAVACRGDIRSMVALALSVRGLLEEAAQDLEEAHKALRGKEDGIFQEIEVELARVDQTLAQLSPMDPQRRELEQHRVELVAGRDERLQKAIGSGLEAGVFVTWGREANVIDVGSPEVGQWRVIIAEQLNAAARGTARSARLQKERTERRLAMERTVGRPLIDPFFVHTSPDPDDISTTTEFHNAGSSLTGEALAAYQAASGADLVFRPLSVPRASLPPRLHRYWLTRPTEQFVLCTDPRGVPGLLFRWSGRTIFRGLEANGGVDIWEILLVDRGFGRDFCDALAAA
jgi:hypothetical protein